MRAACDDAGGELWAMTFRIELLKLSLFLGTAFHYSFLIEMVQHLPNFRQVEGHCQFSPPQESVNTVLFGIT